jgi:hypothetical protein
MVDDDDDRPEVSLLFAVAAGTCIPVENYFESRKSTQSLRFVHTHILTKIHSTCPTVSSFL